MSRYNLSFLSVLLLLEVMFYNIPSLYFKGRKSRENQLLLWKFLLPTFATFSSNRNHFFGLIAVFTSSIFQHFWNVTFLSFLPIMVLFCTFFFPLIIYSLDVLPRRVNKVQDSFQLKSFLDTFYFHLSTA